MARKSNPIDIVDDYTLKNYFALTMVIGIGFFIILILFALSIQSQSRDELKRFEAHMEDRHREVVSHIKLTQDQFGLAREALNASVSMPQEQMTYLKKHLADSPFICVMVVNKIPGRVEVEQTEVFKQDGADGCSRFDLTIFDSLRDSSEARARTAFELFQGAIITVAQRLSGENKYVVGVLPVKNLIPQAEQSKILASVEAVSSGSTSGPIIRSTNDGQIYEEKQERFYNEILHLKYTLHDKTFTGQVGWAWIVLLLGLVIVTLVAYIIYSLIHQNQAIRVEVRDKTRDLTIATQQAILANETKSRFLATISHEIRTPLNLILGMAELLAETPINKEQKEYVNTFSRAGQHLLELINDILDLAMIESGEVSLSETEVDIAALLENVSDFVAPACRMKGVEFRHYIAPDIPQAIYSDGKRLRQVLINLLNNSLKYTDRGEICLKLKKAENNILFEVSDTGTGIPVESQSRIFEAFYQVDSSSKRRRGGVGLGLALVRTYVRLLGGEIRLKSTMGQGSTFCVTFKLKSARAESWLKPFKAEAANYLKAPQSIMLVSREATQTTFVRDCLEWLGHKVTVVESPRAALRILDQKRDKFHYVVVDMAPEEFLDQYKARGLNLERLVVLVPLAQDSDEKHRILSVGPIQICFTPLKMKALLRCLGPQEQREKASEDFVPAVRQSISTNSEDNGAVRIIIAEDDTDNKFLLQSYLSREALDVSYVENGKEALELYKNVRGEVDLIVTDIQMPKMDGIELIRRIREFENDQNLPRKPIVVLSADASDKQHSEVLALGADHYITKPVRKNNLINAIHKFAVQIKTPHGDAGLRREGHVKT